MRGTSAVLLLAALVGMATADDEICEGVCEFEFVVERRSSHLYKDGPGRYDVGLQGSQLVTRANEFRDKLVSKPVPEDALKKVVTLDGQQRDIIVINDQFPGPNIHVKEGSQVCRYTYLFIYLFIRLYIHKYIQ